MAKRSKKLNVKNVIKLITFLIVVGIAVYQYFEEISLNGDLAEIDKKYFVYAVRQKLDEMGTKTHGATMKHIIKKDFDSTLIH